MAGAACVAAFLALLHVPTGYLDLGFTRMTLPKELYATPWLSWLGFPGPGFVSGDYYPVLPYLLMYLAGASAGPSLKDSFCSGRIRDLGLRPLEWLGRHALLVYAAHQPVLLVVASLVSGRSLL